MAALSQRSGAKIMRKWMFGVLLLLSVLLTLPALAEEARDITDQCTLKETSGSKFKNTRLFDRDYGSYWESYKNKHAYVQFSAPEGEKISGVYVCFADKVLPWEVQVKENGAWTTVYSSEGQYAHEFAPLDNVKEFRLRNSQDKQTILNISEIFILSEGDVPSWVQIWQPTLEKADLLVLSAHPDDEILFFGGAIPYYAGELDKDVLVAYLTCGTMERRSELLNGLWQAGVRHYPVIGDFWDKYSTKLDTAYENWGKTKVMKFVTELYRTYQPEVVLTHDVNGEYGHGAHRVCADAAQKCVEYAADGEKWPEIGASWQVKKLYLHMYAENAIEMDWDQPLEAFDGLTGYEVAVQMYDFHVSQHEAGQKNKETGEFEVFIVEPRDSHYSCYRFGLVHTTVGVDTVGNDFFENIPAE